MDKSSLDVKRKINQKVVDKIRQTYGLMKNDHPTVPSRATTTTKAGKQVNYYLGENFRSRLQPDISDKDLRDYFLDQKYIYNPSQIVD